MPRQRFGELAMRKAITFEGAGCPHQIDGHVRVSGDREKMTWSEGLILIQEHAGDHTMPTNRLQNSVVTQSGLHVRGRGAHGVRINRTG
jgi:hypothetical protein